MMKRPSPLIALAALLLMHLSGVPAGALEKPVVVVFEFTSEGVSTPVVRQVARRLRSELTEINRMTVLERDDIDKVLEAVGRNFDDCTEEGCGIEMGRQLDAEMIVLGEVSKLPGRLSLSARLVDMETTKQVVSRTLECDREAKVLDLVPRLARGLAGGVTLKARVARVEGGTVYLDAVSVTRRDAE